MIHTLRSIAAQYGQFTISVVTLIIVAMVVPQQLHADENLSENESTEELVLPALGNTTESDKQLLREIRDEQIYEPEPASVVLNDSEANPDNSPAPSLANTTDDRSVWEVLRQGESMNLAVSEAVEQQKKQYLKEALWINKILRRATPYLQFIVSELEERNLPLDLALIPAIESGFQPRATSPNQAVGLWQIVPVTAKEIGIKQTPWFDPRTDLVTSTRAALDYLSYLNAEFNGEWDLTLAAYNAGPGRVRSAIRRNKKRGLPTAFEALRLPNETKEYVPKVAAMIELVTAQPKSPLDLPDIANVPSFTLVDVGQRISTEVAAEIAEEKKATIGRLNAGLIHGVTPPRGPHQILLPAKSVPTFRANLAKRKQQRLYSPPGVHVVRKGESISSIALQYGISQKQIRELNGIQGSRILIGQKLEILDNKTRTAQPEQNTTTAQPLIHVVTSGDSISSIAHLYQISERKLRTLNNLNGNKILIGQKLAVLDYRATTSIATIDYVIQPGDTLSEIAVRFKVKMADIRLATGGSAIDKLLIPGKTLKIRTGT